MYVAVISQNECRVCSCCAAPAAAAAAAAAATAAGTARTAAEEDGEAAAQHEGEWYPMALHCQCILGTPFVDLIALLCLREIMHFGAHCESSGMSSVN